MKRPLWCDFGRLLYLAELLVFVLPLIAVLLQFVALLAFLSFGGLTFALTDIVSGSSLESSSLIQPLCGSLICVFLGVACWQFVVLSSDYMRRTPSSRRRWLRRYIGGLLAAVPPLLPAMSVAARDFSVGQPALIWLLYLSGLPILNRPGFTGE